MEAETSVETDTGIDAADELALEIVWGEEEARSLSEHGGELSAFCALSCANTELWRFCLRTGAGFHFSLSFARASTMSCSGSTISGNTILGPQKKYQKEGLAEKVLVLLPDVVAHCGGTGKKQA